MDSRESCFFSTGSLGVWRHLACPRDTEGQPDTLNSGVFQTWEWRGSTVEDAELQDSRGRGQDVGECKLLGFYMDFVFLFR